MLKKISNVDMAKYKAQTMVRRKSTCALNYQNIGILVDADTDG